MDERVLKILDGFRKFVGVYDTGFASLEMWIKKGKFPFYLSDSSLMHKWISLPSPKSPSGWEPGFLSYPVQKSLKESLMSYSIFIENSPEYRVRESKNC
jgi:hypothetical protein